MPKLKTNKAFKKRFKLTKNGKALRSKASKRHLMAGKSSSKKRQMRGWHSVHISDVKRIKKALPYG